MSESSRNENLVKSEGQKDDNPTEKIVEDEKPESSNNQNAPNNSTEDSLENGVKKEETFDNEEKAETSIDEEVSDEEESKPTSKVVTKISSKTLYQEPEFAEICSFFNAFGSAIGLKYSIEHLEKLFCTHVNGKADPELIELHLYLMRRVRINWARADKFDLCLQRYCEICPALDSEILELKRFEYVDLSMNAKLTIIKALCESQFDFNYKFKEAIFHTFSHFELRLAPIGFDKNGSAFYYQQDFKLALRVYSYEVDDQSGASWALRAKSAKELYKLIQDLKSPDYASKKESDNEDEIDEENIVGVVVKSESKDEKIEELDENEELVIEMSDADKEKIQMYTKKYTCWDIFRGEDQLNKKKAMKEERRKNRTVVPEAKVKKDEELDDAKSDKSDEKVEEPEEEDLSEFMEDRRILPRRSARSNAINNLKHFITPSRKRTAPDSKDPKKSDTNEKPISEAEDSSEEEEFEESDNDEELGSSDDEFNIGSKSKGRSRKKKSDKKQRKPKQTSIIPRKRAPKPVAFDEESSSDEDQEEVKQKERKKANEKSLCMKCRGSKRPDVLLLCDMCDDAWHIFCLKPPLHFVPDGDWFCPNCNHQMLVQKLSFAFIQHQELQKVKDEEERQKAIEIERLNRTRRKPTGISLNNIIQPQNQYDSTEFQSSEEDIDDGQRKSKRRALKKVCKRTYQDQREFYTGPVVTIAEGRSRRALNKAYDEQLQEAMHTTDSPPAQSAYERPTGLGRGKDMATILEAEERRGSLDDGEFAGEEEEEDKVKTSTSQNNGDEKDDENEDEVEKESSQKVERKQGRAPVKKKKARKSKKLTDLNLDNATESDTDEYRASEDEQAEADEPSSDEYVPSEEERRRTRGSGRGAQYLSKTRSDEEFIDDSDSDYELITRKGKGKAAVNRKRKFGGKVRGGKRSKRNKRWSESEEETEESEPEYQSEESSEDDKPRRRVGNKPTKSSLEKSTGRKWEPKGSSSEDEEVEMEEDSDGSRPTTETGRPLRRAATEMKKKLDELEKQGEEIDHEVEDEEEEGESKKVVDTAKIIGQPRRRIAKIDSDEEDEFKPEENESDAVDESVDEEIEEELAKELIEKKEKRKRRAESSESESDEEPSKPVKESAKSTVKVVPQRPTTSRHPPQKSNANNGTSRASIKRQETQESQRVSTPEDPTPPVSANRRGGRRKSDAPSTPKSPVKSGRKPRQSNAHPTNSAKQILPPQTSQHQSTQHVDQMRPLMHHSSGQSPNLTYITPQQTVAYALPPHIRPMTGVHYVQAPPAHLMQQGYEYYGAPPQYLHGPPTSHHYPPPPAHLIAQPNTYQVYTMPGYSHGDQSQVTQLQTMRPVDPDSLGHALAGAMNPDSL